MKWNDALWDRVDQREKSIVAQFLEALPVKVGALAEALGMVVLRSPLKPDISGLIRPSSKAPAGFEILVNKFEVPERQRFTIGHEIGHFLLHKEDIGPGVIDSVMYRSSLSSRKEAEANRIAASIVMPAAAVSEELARLGGQRSDQVAQALAEMFKVSLPAMRVRLGIA